MNALQAFAARRSSDPEALVQSLGTVLLLRGEPIAAWSGEDLRFTSGVWHTLEAVKVLNQLGEQLGIGPLFLRGSACQGKLISSAPWYQLKGGSANGRP